MFEFLTLTMSAAVISLFGFTLDNTIIIVSAMLISPLMSPLVDLTNGVLSNNKKLFLEGLKMETIGVSICLVTGYFGGLIMGCFYQQDWPNNEMLSRTMVENLIISIFIAIFSSFAFGVKIINNDIGSAIGTAISTSILPPAVNCGMLLAYCTLKNDSEYVVGSIISICVSLLNIVIIVMFSSGTIHIYNKRQEYKKDLKGVPYLVNDGTMGSVNYIDSEAYKNQVFKTLQENKYNHNFDIV